MARIPRLTPFSRLARACLGAAIGLGVALLLLLLRGSDVFESVELKLVDARTRHFASERAADARIVICQVEEGDIAAVRRTLGVRWPWPLEYNAHLVRVLHEAGAAALMVDILHLDRGAGPDDVPGGEDLPTAARQLREIEAAGAQEYGAALEDFGKAAVAFELSMAPQYELAGRVAAAESRLGGEDLRAAEGNLQRTGADLPVRPVAEGAARLGFVNTPPDLDGTVRRAVTRGRWGERPVVSLPRATAQLVTDTADAQAAFLVNFQDGAYARVAPRQVLDWALRKAADGTLPDEASRALGGKIVVLGINAAGLKDVVATPLGTMDGPVFQATVLDNLLHGDGRTPASRTTERVFLAVLLALAGMLGGLLRGRFVPHAGPLLLAAAHVGYAYLRFEAGTSHDLFTPLLGLLLTWGGTSALHAFTAGRRNRWLESAFGRYMAPSVIEALKKDPTLLELGGRDREVSVLFSDIAGFTSVSEQLEPSQVVELLNRYLTAHCAAVLNEDGVVDKFMGDGVLAFYGDPVPQEDHALRACRAALRVQAELPQLAPTLAKLGLGSFEVRIGINTGKAVVGNLGSEQRFDYTCMGDTVNLASRLEGAAKAFGVSVLVGAGTARSVAAAMLLKPLGGVVVVGREEPVSVFELVALRAGAAAELVAHVEAFEHAVSAARRGDLLEARRQLDAADAARSGDGAVAWLRGVLADLAAGSTWDGVTVLSDK